MLRRMNSSDRRSGLTTLLEELRRIEARIKGVTVWRYFGALSERT